MKISVDNFDFRPISIRVELRQLRIGKYACFGLELGTTVKSMSIARIAQIELDTLLFGVALAVSTGSNDSIGIVIVRSCTCLPMKKNRIRIEIIETYP